MAFQVGMPSSDDALAGEVADPAKRLVAGSSGENRQEDVEELIRDAVAWGYKNAGAFKRVPEPTIRWEPDGSPSITFPEAAKPRGTIELYRDRSDGFRWRLKAPNGMMLLASESHATKEGALDEIEYVRRLLQSDDDSE